MSLRVYGMISTIMRRLKTRRIRGVITMVTFTHCMSLARSSFLPTTRNGQFRNVFQAQEMALSSDSSAQAIKEIAFDDLQEQLNKSNIILIDVREPKELAKDGKIPKSVNIPLGDVKGAFALSAEKFQQKYGIPLPSKNDANLVFSCQSGRRATLAIEEVRKIGYTNASCYCGSFLDWKAKGGQILNV